MMRSLASCAVPAALRWNAVSASVPAAPAQCSTRFYDLQHDPMTCPSCGAVYTVEALQNGRTRAMIAEKSAALDNDQDAVLDDEDLDEDSTELDDDLLEDNDDDGDVSLDDIADVAEPDED